MLFKASDFVNTEDKHFADSNDLNWYPVVTEYYFPEETWDKEIELRNSIESII